MIKSHPFLAMVHCLTISIGLDAQPYYLRGAQTVGPCDWGNTNSTCELTDPDGDGVYTVDAIPDDSEWKVWDQGNSIWLPAGANMWIDNSSTGTVTFGLNSTTFEPVVLDGFSSLCAPGDWNAGGVWDNTTAMTTPSSNTYCYTVPSPGTYNWKPVDCGTFNTFNRSSYIREADSGVPLAWNVTTTFPNQEICLEYDPTTGNLVLNSLSLPVRWGAVTATVDGGETLIRWSTTSEINNEGFIVERSTTGVDFEELDYVAPLRDHSATKQYLYYDTKPPAGLVYYRIAQYDYDGTVSYSQMVRVQTEGKPYFAYPSTTTGEIFVNTQEQDNVRVQVADMTGRIVLSTTINSGGTSPIRIDHLAAGMYTVLMQSQYDHSILGHSRVLLKH